MSASSKIFERVHLPKEQFKMYFLDWTLPLSKKEPLQNYAKRFSELITAPNPVIVGVSFGGILAQEIAKIIACKKIILISSVENQDEYSPFFKFLKTTRLYKLYPVDMINFIESWFYKYGSKKTKNVLISYRKYLPLRDRIYTHWAIRSFLLWESSENNIPTLRLHGNQDKIIPHQYINKHEQVENGTHVMIITKTHCIQQRILQFLA